MSAWAASPYRAVNMYVGGASRGCPNQPNLTASWVDTVVGTGWTLIPTYVGLQATCSNYSHRITTGKEKAQGTASADDAVAILKSLGLGAGSIVYFDIEAYDYTKKKCVAKAQTFLNAWTVRLHALQLSVRLLHELQHDERNSGLAARRLGVPPARRHLVRALEQQQVHDRRPCHP